jgi:uncharacterized protein YgbK (DUF1537 family)
MTFRNDERSGIAILADDLTSAGHGAAPFRRAGHDARILLSTPATVPRHATGVTAVDLGSRVLDEETASRRTWRAARLFAYSELLFKKVDSTLRGHVAAEVRTARAGSRRRAVVIAPAFPAEGRVTVEGVQYVRGVPVHESDFARDPVHPARCSDLATLFPEAVLTGPGRAAELPELIDNGDLIVCSAAGDGDLDRLVAAVPRLDDVLWVGSPGLAAALARRCAGGRSGLAEHAFGQLGACLVRGVGASPRPCEVRARRLVRRRPHDPAPAIADRAAEPRGAPTIGMGPAEAGRRPGRHPRRRLRRSTRRGTAADPGQGAGRRRASPG